MQQAELDLIAKIVCEMCHGELIAVLAMAEEAHVLVPHGALLLPPVRLEHLISLLHLEVTGAPKEAREQPGERRQLAARRGGGRVDEEVDGEGGLIMRPRRILERDGHLEEDGVAMGGDDGGMHNVVDCRLDRPVEVQPGHQGWVGDPQRRADPGPGAVVDHLRRGRVPMEDAAPRPAAVDESVQEQPRRSWGIPDRSGLLFFFHDDAHGRIDRRRSIKSTSSAARLALSRVDFDEEGAGSA